MILYAILYMHFMIQISIALSIQYRPDKHVHKQVEHGASMKRFSNWISCVEILL